MLRHALDDAKTLRRRYAAMIRLSETAITVLGCFKSSPEKRLTMANLMAETGIQNRRIIQNALTSLTKAGFLQLLGAGASSRYQIIF